MTTASTLLFDPTDPQLRRDPYPTYRRMREESPAWRSPEGVWYFTRYADCVELMKSEVLSYDSTASKAYRAGLSSDPEVRENQLAETRKNRSLLDVDPPEHTRLRSLINRAFTPQVVQAMDTTIVGYVDRLMDEFDGPTVDLVADFGSMVPVLVICNMLGIAEEERHEFLAVGDRVSRSVDPDVPMTEKLAANARMREYIAGIIEQRRANPGDDVVTRLIEATEDGRVADLDELVINTGILLIAGFETTTNLITNGVFRMLEAPDQLAMFLADPDLDDNTVEEMLRFDPPSQFMRPRTIAAEVEIAGVELQPGDPVVPLLAAANRDPEEFDDPEHLHVDRGVNRHMSFGVGLHRCIGAGLARVEAARALRRLLQRYPNLTLADEEPEYRPNLQLRGFSKLPVTLA
jgi:cytochrome P450